MATYEDIMARASRILPSRAGPIPRPAAPPPLPPVGIGPGVGVRQGRGQGAAPPSIMPPPTLAQRAIGWTGEKVGVPLIAGMRLLPGGELGYQAARALDTSGRATGAVVPAVEREGEAWARSVEVPKWVPGIGGFQPVRTAMQIAPYALGGAAGRGAAGLGKLAGLAAVGVERGAAGSLGRGEPAENVLVSGAAGGFAPVAPAPPLPWTIRGAPRRELERMGMFGDVAAQAELSRRQQETARLAADPTTYLGGARAPEPTRAERAIGFAGERIGVPVLMAGRALPGGELGYQLARRLDPERTRAATAAVEASLAAPKVPKWVPLVGGWQPARTFAQMAPLAFTGGAGILGGVPAGLMAVGAERGLAAPVGRGAGPKEVLVGGVAGALEMGIIGGAFQLGGRFTPTGRWWASMTPAQQAAVRAGMPPPTPPPPGAMKILAGYAEELKRPIPSANAAREAYVKAWMKAQTGTGKGVSLEKASNTYIKALRRLPTETQATHLHEAKSMAMARILESAPTPGQPMPGEIALRRGLAKGGMFEYEAGQIANLKAQFDAALNAARAQGREPLLRPISKESIESLRKIWKADAKAYDAFWNAPLPTDAVARAKVLNARLRVMHAISMYREPVVRAPGAEEYGKFLTFAAVAKAPAEPVRPGLFRALHAEQTGEMRLPPDRDAFISRTRGLVDVATGLKIWEALGQVGGDVVKAAVAVGVQEGLARQLAAAVQPAAPVQPSPPAAAPVAAVPKVRPPHTPADINRAMALFRQAQESGDFGILEDLPPGMAVDTSKQVAEMSMDLAAKLKTVAERREFWGKLEEAYAMVQRGEVTLEELAAEVAGYQAVWSKVDPIPATMLERMGMSELAAEPPPAAAETLIPAGEDLFAAPAEAAPAPVAPAAGAEAAPLAITEPHFDFIKEEIRRAPIGKNWASFPYRLRETGQVFEIDARQIWGKTYYSFDGGETQARTKREAFRLASPSAIARFAGPRSPEKYPLSPAQTGAEGAIARPPVGAPPEVAPEAFSGVAFHGTTPAKMKAIQKKGFAPKIVNGQWFGSGVYLAPDVTEARQYGEAVAPFAVNLKNPFVYEVEQWRGVEDWYSELQDKVDVSLTDEYGEAVTVHTRDPETLKPHLSPAATDASEAITEYLRSLGHDGVLVKDRGKIVEIVVFDPAGIKPAAVPAKPAPAVSPARELAPPTMPRALPGKVEAGAIPAPPPRTGLFGQEVRAKELQKPLWGERGIEAVWKKVEGIAYVLTPDGKYATRSDGTGPLIPKDDIEALRADARKAAPAEVKPKVLGPPGPAREAVERMLAEEVAAPPARPPAPPKKPPPPPEVTAAAPEPEKVPGAETIEGERIRRILSDLPGKEKARLARRAGLEKVSPEIAKLIKTEQAARKFLDEVWAKLKAENIPAEVEGLEGVAATPLLDWLGDDKIAGWPELQAHGEIRDMLEDRPGLRKFFILKQPPGPRPAQGFLDQQVELAKADRESGFRGDTVSDFLDQMVVESEKARPGMGLADRADRYAAELEERGEHAEAARINKLVELIGEAETAATDASHALGDAILPRLVRPLLGTEKEVAAMLKEAVRAKEVATAEARAAVQAEVSEVKAEAQEQVRKALQTYAQLIEAEREIAALGEGRDKGVVALVSAARDLLGRSGLTEAVRRDLLAQLEKVATPEQMQALVSRSLRAIGAELKTSLASRSGEAARRILKRRQEFDRRIEENKELLGEANKADALGAEGRRNLGIEELSKMTDRLEIGLYEHTQRNRALAEQQKQNISEMAHDVVSGLPPKHILPLAPPGELAQPREQGWLKRNLAHALPFRKFVRHFLGKEGSAAWKIFVEAPVDNAHHVFAVEMNAVNDNWVQMVEEATGMKSDLPAFTEWLLETVRAPGSPPMERRSLGRLLEMMLDPHTRVWEPKTGFNIHTDLRGSVTKLSAADLETLEAWADKNEPALVRLVRAVHKWHNRAGHVEKLSDNRKRLHGQGVDRIKSWSYSPRNITKRAEIQPVARTPSDLARRSTIGHMRGRVAKPRSPLIVHPIDEIYFALGKNDAGFLAYALPLRDANQVLNSPVPLRPGEDYPLHQVLQEKLGKRVFTELQGGLTSLYEFLGGKLATAENQSLFLAWGRRMMTRMSKGITWINPKMFVNQVAATLFSLSDSQSPPIRYWKEAARKVFSHPLEAIRLVKAKVPEVKFRHEGGGLIYNFIAGGTAEKEAILSHKQWMRYLQIYGEKYGPLMVEGGDILSQAIRYRAAYDFLFDKGLRGEELDRKAAKLALRLMQEWDFPSAPGNLSGLQRAARESLMARFLSWFRVGPTNSAAGGFEILEEIGDRIRAGEDVRPPLKRLVAWLVAAMALAAVATGYGLLTRRETRTVGGLGKEAAWNTLDSAFRGVPGASDAIGAMRWTRGGRAQIETAPFMRPVEDVLGGMMGLFSAIDKADPAAARKAATRMGLALALMHGVPVVGPRNVWKVFFPSGRLPKGPEEKGGKVAFQELAWSASGGSASAVAKLKAAGVSLTDARLALRRAMMAKGIKAAERVSRLRKLSELWRGAKQAA